jgi:plasmid stability protein
MVDLLVRGANGRSQEAELRAILSAALLSPLRRSLAELDVFDYTNVISEARKGRRPR